MSNNRRLLRLLGAIAVGYAFLLTVLLTWGFLEGPPYESATPVRLLGIGLCLAIIGLLTFAAAIVGLNWPKRVAGLVVGTAALAALLVGLFDWPVFFLWQFLIELSVEMVFQLAVLIGVSWMGYGFVLAQSDSLPAESECQAPMRLSIRDLFLLITAFALLFASLRPLQPSTQQGWFSFALVACGVLCGTVSLMTIWGALSNAQLAVRCLVLLLPAPLAAVGFWITKQFHPDLLHNEAWYACGALVQMVFMLLPLLLVVRWHGIRYARLPSGELRTIPDVAQGAP